MEFPIIKNIEKNQYLAALTVITTCYKYFCAK